MNIGLDYTGIDPSYRGGLNTYAIGFLRGLVRVAKKHKIQLFVTKDNRFFLDNFPGDSHVEAVVVPLSGKIDSLVRNLSLLSSCTQFKALHQKLVDTVLGPRAEVMDRLSDIIYVPTTVLYPYTYQKPTILSMHDIQQVHYPQFFSKMQLNSRQMRFQLSAEKVTYVQASSQFIKEDLLGYFKCLSPEQIAVIPEGVTIEEFSSPIDNDVVVKYGLPSDFLFFPAQLWFHKNHITVLKALNRLYQERGFKIPMVMTGGKFTGAEQIMSYVKDQKMDYVHYLGKVPFSDMVALYQRARFFITAALYESSSLPFLEAAAAGCPVIASDTPPNREMARILKASLFDVLNDGELAELLATIWEDDTLIRDHVNHNRFNIDYYSWDNAALRFLEFVESRIQP